MAKCELCNREIGDTAGPCIQCTILAKKNQTKPVNSTSSKKCLSK